MTTTPDDAAKLEWTETWPPEPEAPHWHLRVAARNARGDVFLRDATVHDLARLGYVHERDSARDYAGTNCAFYVPSAGAHFSAQQLVEALEQQNAGTLMARALKAEGERYGLKVQAGIAANRLQTIVEEAFGLHVLDEGDDWLSVLERKLFEQRKAFVEQRAALEQERDVAQKQVTWFVEQAADVRLDGYRELGERAAKAEEERDHWRAQHAALMVPDGRMMRERDAYRDQCTGLATQLERALQALSACVSALDNGSGPGESASVEECLGAVEIVREHVEYLTNQEKAAYRARAATRADYMNLMRERNDLHGELTSARGRVAMLERAGAGFAKWARDFAGAVELSRDDRADFEKLERAWDDATNRHEKAPKEPPSTPVKPSADGPSGLQHDDLQFVYRKGFDAYGEHPGGLRAVVEHGIELERQRNAKAGADVGAEVQAAEAMQLLRELDDAAVSIVWRGEQGQKWAQRWAQWLGRDSRTRCGAAESLVKP